jgi:hypothetical protein
MDKFTDSAERLSEIKAAMLDLLNEAKELVEGTPEQARAEAYWLSHIRCALDDDHDFLGGVMITLQDTADRLSGEEKVEDLL